MKKKDRDIRRLKRHVEMLERAATALTSDDLLDLLGISAESPMDDLRRMVRLKQSSELSASYIARGICESPRFKKWQSKDISATLFIEGRGPAAFQSRSSPVSHISTSVIEHLQDQEPAVAVYFFCGFHDSLENPKCGPRMMIRSLICQMLRLFSLQLDFISSRRYRDQLEALSFQTLLDCFGKLVRRLPMTTVLFCVIDDIHFFDRREWAEDCRSAIRDIQDLVEDEELGAVVKLLITSSSRTRFIGDIVPSPCRLLLPTRELNGRDGPTERQMSMAARRPSIRTNRGDIVPSLQMRNYADSEDEDLTDLSSESDDSVSSGVI